MQYLKTLGLLLLLFIFAQIVSAQKTTPDKVVVPRQLTIEKPSLFINFPEKLQIEKQRLDQVFTTRLNRVSLPADKGISFDGTILEKVQKNPNVVSINIRLHNYDSSLLNISRIIQSDLSVTYTARILNIKNGDILLLKNEDGRFYFIREKQSLVIVE